MSLTDVQNLLECAYSRLTPPELGLFLKLRGLPIQGERIDQITRLVQHDIKLYGKDASLPVTSKSHHNTLTSTSSIEHPTISTSNPAAPLKTIPALIAPRRCRHRHGTHSNNETCTSFYSTLPIELWALVMEYLDDVAGGGWEVSMALGIPTYMKRPSDWEKNATPIDYAILTGSVAEVKRVITENCTEERLMKNLASGTTFIGTAVKHITGQALRFSEVGANVMCRFGYTNLLTYFWTHDPKHFVSILGGCFIPTKASLYNTTNVLDWWFNNSTPISKQPYLSNEAAISASSTLYRSYNEEAIDGASRNANLAVLQWWKSSGLALSYSEAALEGASGRGHIDVLEWWKQSGFALKIAKVMDLASLAGHVNVLEWWSKSGIPFTYDKALLNASGSGGVDVLAWWKTSGLRLIYDGQALTAATLHDRPEVLTWWKNSGLLIRYRICDIEEALEDAVGGGNAARRWWMAQGINFNASNKEWSSDRVL